MNRLFTIVTILCLAGCSSDAKKPKFEAAENSSSDSSKKTEKKVPDWMKTKSDDKSDTGKSISSTGTGTQSNTEPSSTGDPKQTPDDSVAKTPSKEAKKAETKTVLTPPATSGETTALMAKLSEKYQNAQKFFNDMKNKRMSEQEIVRVREQYAKMIEEWLAVADQLMKLDLRENDRITVVSLKRLAHQTLVQYNRPEHEQLLYEFGDSLKDDTSIQIKKIYQLLKLQKPVAEILRGNKIDEETFFADLDKLVSYWRDDYAVYQNIEVWLNQIYPINRDYFVRGLEIAARHFTQSTDTQVMQRSDTLKDRLKAAKLGFDLAVTDVAEEKPGAPEKLIETTKRLLAQPDFSLFNLNQIVQAGHQLETMGEFEAAKKFFGQLRDETTELKNPRMKEAVKMIVDNALKRADMIGKPLKVEGMIPRIEAGEFLRKPMDFSSYKGKVVILIFWAFENKTSYQMMDQLDKLVAANADKDLALIAINADRRMEVISQVMAMEISRKKRVATHLMPLTPKVLGLGSEMAQKCGVDTLPFTVVIDQKGNVDSYRGFGLSVQEAVSRLLGSPIKEVFLDPKKQTTESEKGPAKDAPSDGKSDKPMPKAKNGSDSGATEGKAKKQANTEKKERPEPPSPDLNAGKKNDK